MLIFVKSVDSTVSGLSLSQITWTDSLRAGSRSGTSVRGEAARWYSSPGSFPPDRFALRGSKVSLLAGYWTKRFNAMINSSQLTEKN